MKTFWPITCTLLLILLTGSWAAVGSEYQVRINTSFYPNPKIYGSFKPAKARATIRQRQIPVQVTGRLVLNKQKLFVLQENSGKVTATGLNFERLKKPHKGKSSLYRIQAQGQEKALAHIYLPYIQKAMNAGGPKGWRQLPNEITMQDVICTYQGPQMDCQALAIVRLGTPGEAKLAVQNGKIKKAARSGRPSRSRS